jgi:hypothetical protein
MVKYANTVNLNGQVWVFFEGSSEEIRTLQREALEKFSPMEVSISLMKTENNNFEMCQVGFCFDDPKEAMMIKLSY